MVAPSMAVAAICLVVALASCGSDEETPSASRSEKTSPPASASSPPEEASPIEGTWRTPTITQREAEKTLRQNGLTKWIARFRPLTPIADGTVLVLDIRDEWDLYREVKGGPREEVDYDAKYSVQANKVVVMHSAGSNTFRWSVDGNVLTLVWLKTTIPPTEGVPEEVFQQALYMTSVFERDD